MLKPHQEISVNMGIIIEYPDELIENFILLPSLTKYLEADLHYNKRDLYYVSLFNKSFIEMVTIEKNTGIISMYFLNDINDKMNIKNLYID